MKVVALVSGGKDSCYAMMKCIQYGHQVLTTPLPFSFGLVDKKLKNQIKVEFLDSVTTVFPCACWVLTKE